MDASIQRALNDKLYDKRKVGALEYVSHSLSSSHTALSGFFSLACRADLMFFTRSCRRREPTSSLACVCPLAS